jgi:hypothetical protein
MPRQITEQEFAAIVRAVATFKDGAAVDDIMGALDKPSARRTLQRRLATLVAQNRLSAVGGGWARRYRISAPKAPPEEPLDKAVTLPVSTEARAVRDVVTAPLHQRKPVGYRREFLDTYRPNESAYLSPELRQRLGNMGRGSRADLPPGTYARQVLNRLLIDLSWNSSRLEGNTYSLLETERLLDLGEAAEGKDAREAQMILNHKAAIELLVDQATEIGLNAYTIRNLHALLADNLLADPGACGRLRSIPVSITGTVFHPVEGPQVIEECFGRILDVATSIENAFEQAFFLMVHIPYLQPFEDVNKRVSRLAANIPLIRRNLCPLSFVDVPERDYTRAVLGVYELNRIEYLRDVFVWAYERSCARYAAVRQSLGEPDPFRLRHRDAIRQTVAEVVKSRMDKRSAVRHIRVLAADIGSTEDSRRFAEIVETELQRLHEGSIARYRLRPSEFAAWMDVWR